MSADTRTDPPTPDPLTAIRRRNSDWQSGEFDGVHEHPDTQCSADIDREWLLASLDAASEPDLECLECGGRIGPRRAALPSAPDQRLVEALDDIENGADDESHVRAVVARIRAALSEATTSPEATLDVATLARAIAFMRAEYGWYIGPGFENPADVTAELIAEEYDRLRGPA